MARLTRGADPLAFFPCQFKHEIFRKPVFVAAHRLFGGAGFHAVQLRQILVKHHFMPSNQENVLLDAFHRNKDLCLGHTKLS